MKCFFQGMELRPSGNHLLWPEWVPPTGNTGQWILSAACAGVGGTVCRKKMARKRTAHGASEAQDNLHNYVAEAALFALLCQIAQDAQARGVQRPSHAGKLQCHPFMTHSYRSSSSTLCSDTCQKILKGSLDPILSPFRAVHYEENFSLCLSRYCIPSYTIKIWYIIPSSAFYLTLSNWTCGTNILSPVIY